MIKIALGIEFDGTQYHGWQKQKNAKTVQVEVEKAISKVANHKVEVFCAGRTDARVHAALQVIHFTSSANRTHVEWLCGINANLPLDIRILWVKEVPSHFHARFSALSRQYRYYIYNSRLRSALLHNNVVVYHKELDCDKMQKAVEHWVGEHDFASFQDSQCQSPSSTRLVKQITISQCKNNKFNNLIVFDITARSFLHHMVRNMVGTLLKVGTLEKPISWAKDVLEAHDRTKAGVTAPAHGLYLVNINYPDEFNLPKVDKVDVGPWIFNY